MKKQIAKTLLEIGAVKLNFKNPFKWVSGIESPIYCDNRMIISHPQVRSDIAKAFANIIKTDYPKAEVVVGTATAGIPHAAWLAAELNLPMLYVRSEAKAHGKGKQIEGDFRIGQKAILIEDLISTGKSSVAACEALRSEGIEVLACLSIFTYGLEKAAHKFSDNSISFQSLSDVDALIQYAVESKTINSHEQAQLKDFFKSL